ncbi:hypothetical protein ANCDUO_01599 [Ancylostoma duodenale]|uniref:Uncharacterized protein n=1 Tax=Ancylostoma duodenale TaxID=51022 RepID=A0A0C2DDQ8_9BILA|nr:hypothetical protein ANCDUO_01599 [Ancylostoma duodenale]
MAAVLRGGAVPKSRKPSPIHFCEQQRTAVLRGNAVHHVGGAGILHVHLPVANEQGVRRDHDHLLHFVLPVLRCSRNRPSQMST